MEIRITVWKNNPSPGEWTVEVREKRDGHLLPVRTGTYLVKVSGASLHSLITGS